MRPALPDSGARPARRRNLTILFSDLSDATRLAAGLEPEEYLDILDHLKRCVQEVLVRHGGALVDVQGDGLLAMFGYPTSTEDDSRRATDAALALHESVRRIALPLPAWAADGLRLHSGIHAGLVLLIEGDPAPGRFLLVGDATNVAARLSDAAGRDEILVSASTLGSERHFFEVIDRGLISLRGKAEPVAVYQVVRQSDITTRFQARTRRGFTSFVGRRRERDLLSGALEKATVGRLQMVSVVGAPGVGKTRLIEEFLAQAEVEGHLVCRGFCESHFSAEPLQPFRQMLRDSELGRHLDANALAGGDRTATVLQERCAILARTRTLVLFIDDWHLADDASRQTLSAIRQLVTSPVLIITASRVLTPRDIANSMAELIELPPLSEDESGEAIHCLRSDADPFVVKDIQQRSGGNPLFIEELCHVRVEYSAGRRTSRSEHVPAWLSALVESRVERLPTEQRDVVRSAAIVGPVVPAWLLEQLTGYHADHPLVRDLADKDLIYPGANEETFRFKHGITRDVIYASVGLHEREALHLRIAALLEQHAPANEVAEALAYHYRAAAVPHLAARYAEIAGDKAMATPALDRARRQYCVALDALERLEPTEETSRRWSAIAERLGLACVYDPTRDQLSTFVKAAELAMARSDMVAMARAAYWLGYISYAVGDLHDSIARLTLARGYCDSARRSGPVPVDFGAFAAQVVATLGQAHAATGAYTEALPELDEAISIKRRHWSGSRPAVGLAYSLACKGFVLGDQGAFADAHELFRQALDAAGRHDPVEGSVLGWQGAVYLWQGRWHEALTAADRQRAIGERVESLYILAISHAIQGYARWRLDRDPAAIESVRRSARWLEGRDQRLLISVLYGWLAEMMSDVQRWDEVRTHAALALRRSRAGDCLGEPIAWLALSRVPDEHHSGMAERYIRRAMAAATARGSQPEIAFTLMCHGRLQLRRGRPAEAASLLTRARFAFCTLDMPWHAARAEQFLADM